MYEKTSKTVAVVVGLAGSGKTTFIRSLCSAGPLAGSVSVILNDFGEEVLEGMLIDPEGSIPFFELPGGCICCSMSDGLGEALEAATGSAASVVLIEANGLADPASLLKELRIYGVRPEVVVACVDVRTVGPDFADDILRARHCSAANAIVLTKGDLVVPGAAVSAAEYLADKYPPAVVRDLDVRRYDPLMAALLTPLAPPPAVLPQPGQMSLFDEGVMAWALVPDVIAPREVLEEIFSALPSWVVRCKGWVYSSGVYSFVNAVGRDIVFTDVEAARTPPSGFAVITRDVGRHEVASLFAPLHPFSLHTIAIPHLSGQR